MKKKIKSKILITTILFLSGTLSVYSQNTSMPIDQNDIEKLNKRISKLFNKSDCKKSEKTRLISVFFVVYNGDNNKNHFINGSFEQSVQPSFFNYKLRKYLTTESFICKEDGELLALSDGRSIYCLSNYNETAYIGDKKLVRKIVELDLEAVYYLSLTPLGTYFGIDKNKKTYLIQVKGEELFTYLIEDFPDKEWSELFGF